MIYDSVPLPAPRAVIKKGVTALMRDMKIGNSILMDKGARNNLYCLARQIGITITVRREGDNDIRVWRTS